MVSCPTPGCERRAAILYGGPTFTCRQCGELAYASQGERSAARAIRRVHKIRERLGWGPSLSFEHGDKPKGMHWATFERLVEQHDALAVTGLEGMVARLGLSGGTEPSRSSGSLGGEAGVDEDSGR